MNLSGEAAVEGGEMFVSGVDLEKGREIAEASVYGSLIAKELVLEEMKSELEKAQEAYDKKRMYIECLVVIGIAVVVLLPRNVL